MVEVKLIGEDSPSKDLLKELLGRKGNIVKLDRIPCVGEFIQVSGKGGENQYNFEVTKVVHIAKSTWYSSTRFTGDATVRLSKS